MKLVVFDIDGTLTNTSAVDALCYARALTAVGINAEESDWQTCQHVSDTGIARHLYQTRHGRDPHEHEESILCEQLVRLLHEHNEADASLFAEITGTAAMLVQLANQRDWVIALATGCWRASAEMKLRAAGLSLTDKPAGFAEDGPAREDIVTAAIMRATAHYKRTCFDKIVSIGDGVWDVRTAINLDLPFIGIGAGERATTLRQNGAQHVLADFTDTQLFFTYLEAADIPRNSLSAAR